MSKTAKGFRLQGKSKVRRGRYRIVTQDVSMTFGIHKEDNEMKEKYKLVREISEDGKISPSVKDLFDNNANLLALIESFDYPSWLPERPLLYYTLAYNDDIIKKNIKRYGRYNEHKYIKNIEKQLEVDVKEIALNEMFIQRNAQYTIWKKGFDYPFKRSGELLDAIKAKSTFIKKNKK